MKCLHCKYHIGHNTCGIAPGEAVKLKSRNNSGCKSWSIDISSIDACLEMAVIEWKQCKNCSVYTKSNKGYSLGACSLYKSQRSPGETCFAWKDTTPGALAAQIAKIRTQISYIKR